MEETDDDILWNGSEEDGNVREMKELTVRMETVTLIGKCRQNVTCCVYSVYKMNNKILFLSGYFF